MHFISCPDTYPTQSERLHRLPAVAWQIVEYDDEKGKEDAYNAFVLTGWPETAGYRVPNKISYSYDENGHRQWGYDIGPESTGIVETKLHFDVEPREIELQSIIHTLDRIWDMDVDKLVENGCTTDFPPFDPVVIAADYLRNVREWLHLEFERTYGKGYCDKIATEIIYTIPAVSLATSAPATCVEG